VDRSLYPQGGFFMLRRKQRYVRIKHLGNEDGAIHFSDLDDEENKEQGMGTPVYVSPNSHIDLPMDNEVIHSYEHGSIRGFIEDNQIEAVIHQGDIDRVDLGTSVGKISNGGEYDSQLANGRVIAPDPQDDGKYHPVVKDEITSGTGNSYSHEVANPEKFAEGVWVEIPSVSNGTDRFKRVSSVDESVNEVTFDDSLTSSFSTSEGDVLKVDPSRAHDFVQDANGSGYTITVNDASKFEEGEIVAIGPVEYTKALDLSGSSNGDYIVQWNVQYASSGISKSLSIRSEYTANSDSAGTIATELASILDAHDSVSASVKNTTEIHIDFSTLAGLHQPHIRRWDEFPNIIQSPSGELSRIIGPYDLSIHNTISSVDTGANTITLGDQITWSQGDQIVTEPIRDHEIIKMANDDEGVIAAFEQMSRSEVDGLTDYAETSLENLKLVE
jgi:hypothetical protein